MTKYYVLVAMLLFSFVGCGKKDAPKPAMPVTVKPQSPEIAWPNWNALTDAIPPPTCKLSKNKNGGDNISCDTMPTGWTDKSTWTVTTWPFPCTAHSGPFQDPDGTTYVCTWEGATAPPNGQRRWTRK